jgi:hypothetical protein
LASLAFWLGAIVMTGVAAAVIFPTMHKLNPSLPEFALYPGEHWLIAAGKVAFRILAASDIVKVVCAVLVVVTLAAETWPRSRRGAMMATRWAGLFVLLGLLDYNLATLQPRMTRNLEAYWTSALAGNSEQASKYRAAFDEDHPAATRTMGAMAGALVLNIVVAGWAWAKNGREEVGP